MGRGDFRQGGVTRFFVILELDVISFAGLKELTKENSFPAARTSAKIQVPTVNCQV
jgi:hypothetical protein